MEKLRGTPTHLDLFGPIFMKTYFLPLLLIVAASPAAQLAADAPRPNILYFYVDDMGWGSIGPNGQAQRKANGQPYVRTPNLDRLAAEGINFPHGYGCTLCAPARSSQQSGFHQGHTFADRNSSNTAKKGMRADDILMGDALSAAGYVTGYWGKWGFGGSADRDTPVIMNVQTLPTSHGYQYVLAELHHVRAHTFFQPTLWSAPASPGAIGGLELVPNSLSLYQNNADYPNTPALQNHADYPSTAYCDDTYVFAALDFVRAQGQNYNKTGQPFFGLLAVQTPHQPFGQITKLPDWDRAYTEEPHHSSITGQARQWAAMITRMDAHFGNLLAALEDPNNDGDTADSIADNTLVILQSDNGGTGGQSNVLFDANGGLRGKKATIQEGGIRVPLVMRWPAKIASDSKLKAGSNCRRIVDVTDLLPTFCDLAGAPIPLGIDGVSIAPTLTGTGHQRHREFIIHEADNGQSIIRGNLKLVRSGKAALELYDVETDHAEHHNIAAKHPQVAKELETLLLGEGACKSPGFANTYHHWTGEDGGDTSNPDNWSDYRYANAGITYMTDDGAPELTWVARIENKGSHPNTARADADLEFLGLEIRGNAGQNITQSLVLGPKVSLTGRNEIRLTDHGTLTVDRGTVATLRWIDIKPGGTLNGTGTIDGIVYNSGAIDATKAGQSGFKIYGDYHQSAEASLGVALNGDSQPFLAVEGDAVLDGELAVAARNEFKPVPGKTYTVLTAGKLTGKFNNPQSEVIAAGGTRLSISYTESAVLLSAN